MNRPSSPPVSDVTDGDDAGPETTASDQTTAGALAPEPAAGRAPEPGHNRATRRTGPLRDSAERLNSERSNSERSRAAPQDIAARREAAAQKKEAAVLARQTASVKTGRSLHSGATQIRVVEEEGSATGPAAVAPAARTSRAPDDDDNPLAVSTSVRSLQPVRAPVGKAKMKQRHWGLLFSLALLVLLPAGLASLYLWGRAVDEYASTVGFSVRKEETSSALELLGGISALSGTPSSDTDILYEYIQSQKLVAEIDAKLNLRAIWSKPVGQDPLFAYHAPGTIEDLLGHWQRMVKVYYDSGSGLIEIRVLAFDPKDATAIAQAIFDKSSDMINALSAIAREDAIRYARDDLDKAVEQLKSARQALTTFRNANQLVDPAADIQSQVSLVGSLQVQLAQALIELDLLKDSTGTNDPRVVQAQRRIKVIEDRITSERSKLGIGQGAASGEVLADLAGDYERLVVDREFAEATYTSARAAYEGALADARRQSRYLAAHVLPTTAEKSQFPQRWTLLGITTLFLFLIWSVVVLIYYSLRDRR